MTQVVSVLTIQSRRGLMGDTNVPVLELWLKMGEGLYAQVSTWNQI